MENSGTLPSIPRIVAQVLKELDAEDPNPRSIVMLVSTDPALTAKIIALANSPLFSTGRSIGSLNEAVSVLGFSHVRAMVTTAALASCSARTSAAVRYTRSVKWKTPQPFSSR